MVLCRSLESGETKTPQISWNGEQGSFSLEGEQEEKISIDPITGIISWEVNLLPKQYKLVVISSNSAGTSTTEFTLIVNGPNVNKEDRFRLYQNYPNPASTLTYFVYHLTQKGEVSIDILDINGKTIKTIMSQQVHGEGRYSIQLNVEAMASNLYFMRLYSNSEGTRTIKFVVEK